MSGCRTPPAVTRNTGTLSVRRQFSHCPRTDDDPKQPACRPCVVARRARDVGVHRRGYNQRPRAAAGRVGRNGTP
ncbi:MAG: hypothetical protein ACK55I_04080, partial [bacterium]